MAVLTIVLNMLFIPLYGINGAAAATFLAVLLYNLAKIWFVNSKFKMQPFTLNTSKVLMLIIVSLGVFYFWDFGFHPIINITAKSLLITLFYGITIYSLNFSDDITAIINKLLKR